MIHLFKSVGINPLETRTNQMKFVTIDYNDFKNIETTIQLKDETVELKKDINQWATVFSYVMDKYVEKIREVIKNYDKDVIDAYTLKDKCDKKILTKILKASNDIAINGRIGPANFIMAHSKYLPLVRIDKGLKYYNPSDSICMANFIVCDELENEIIVGRIPSHVDPGVHIVLNEDTWLKNDPYLEVDSEKEFLNVTYAVEPVGKNPHFQYMILKLE